MGFLDEAAQIFNLFNPVPGLDRIVQSYGFGRVVHLFTKVFLIDHTIMIYYESHDPGIVLLDRIG